MSKRHQQEREEHLVAFHYLCDLKKKDGGRKRDFNSKKKETIKLPFLGGEERAFLRSFLPFLCHLPSATFLVQENRGGGKEEEEERTSELTKVQSEKRKEKC